MTPAVKMSSKFWIGAMMLIRHSHRLQDGGFVLSMLNLEISTRCRSGIESIGMRQKSYKAQLY